MAVRFYHCSCFLDKDMVCTEDPQGGEPKGWIWKVL